jgi:cysteine desulfurase
MQTQEGWRNALELRLKSAGATVLGEGARRLPQTLGVAVSDWSAETQVMLMDLAGVMISAGAACSSGKVKPSRTVEAMGLTDLAPGAIRISGGWASTEDDWKTAGDAWLAAFERHRARHAATLKETA